MGFLTGKCSRKSKKRFHVKSAILGFIKNVLNSQEKILNQLVSKKIIIFVSLVFVNILFRFESPKNNKNDFDINKANYFGILYLNVTSLSKILIVFLMP